MKSFNQILFLTLLIAGCASPLRDGRSAFERGDYETARTLWAPLAERGNSDAQYGMGQLELREAKTDSASLQSAMEWYYAAARQGHPDAMFHFGLMLQQTGQPEVGDKWIGYAAACGQADAIDYARTAHIEVPMADRSLMPRDCTRSLVHQGGWPASRGSEAFGRSAPDNRN